MSPWQEARSAVWRAYQEMASKGLVAGASGNVSQRLRGDDGTELIAITPSKRGAAQLTVEDIVVIDFEGNPVEGERAPSVETVMHVEVYRSRPEAGAVVHSHSTYASVLAVAGLELPPILDELVVHTGGEVRVAEYGFPSTEELARNAVAALDGRRAALLRNHGVITIGPTLSEALALAETVERASHIYVFARLLGRESLLPADVIEAEKGMFQMLHGTEGATP